jgi:hypothetical protein
MTNDRALAVFENFKIRRVYDEQAETWSVTDCNRLKLPAADGHRNRR